MLSASPALADGVSVSVTPVALKGTGKPGVTVNIERPLRALELDLTRSDGKEVHVKLKGVGAPSERKFPLDQPDGTFHYDGKVVAVFGADDAEEFPLSFDASIAGPLVLSNDDDAIDLKAHTVAIKANRPVVSLHVEVLADDGHTLAEYDEPVADSKAGQPLKTTWQPDDATATVLRVSVTATDSYGLYTKLNLFPWHIAIPHEDVLFETGKSDILPAERPKLDAANERLQDALEKYGQWVTVQLFIEGHTDTVGDAATNKTLSGARALAIARYFRAHGVRVAIYYAGFGKDGLMVPTPDQTPEARNRRAAYIVAVEPPSNAKWSRLP